MNRAGGFGRPPDIRVAEIDAPVFTTGAALFARSARWRHDIENGIILSMSALMIDVGNDSIKDMPKIDMSLKTFVRDKVLIF